MKQKLLLVGGNRHLINELFVKAGMLFEVLTSSTIYQDLKQHLQYYKPDALVYCMKLEKQEDISGVTKFATDTLKKENIPFIVVSDNSEYDYLCRIWGEQPNLKLTSALSIVKIQEELTAALNKAEGSLLGSGSANSPAGGSGGLDNALNLLDKMENSDDLWDDPLLDDLLNKRSRILVVDDSTIIHKTIKNYLENDYDISTAISGFAALRFLKTKEVDLILLDYEMPEMDGIEVLKAIRNNPATVHIPVIFLTGINDSNKIQKALALKPDGYLLKPINKEALLQKIKELVI